MEMVGLNFGLVIHQKILSSLKRLQLKCKIDIQDYLMSISHLFEHVYPVLMVNLLNAITLIENVVMVIRQRGTRLKENELIVQNYN